MWVHGHASIIGEAHEKNGIPCQDSSVSKILKTKKAGEIFLAGVSDGAGSAKHSDLGSEIVLDTFIMVAQAWIKETGDVEPEHFFQIWFEETRKKLSEKAVEIGAEFRDFAATALLAIVWSDKVAFFQIGDGCIIVDIFDDGLDKDFPSWIFWNDRLDVEVNVTTFVTSDDAWSSADCEIYPARVKNIALFTDGIEHGVMHNKTQSAHENFFARCFNPLKERTESDGISVALKKMLESPAISGFSDDDKSLVLAVRKHESAIGEQRQQSDSTRPKLFQKWR